MDTFYIQSLGCKQNQLEGQIIRNELEKLGYVCTFDIKNAGIYILNSCSVTSHSDSQAIYLLNRAKKINPKIKTILTGCCAQTYKNKKHFDISNVDLVLGNSEKLNIEKYIKNFTQGGFLVKDIFNIKEFENKFLINPYSTRASIKIQDGCNNRCSYCIIPYARGNSRSNSIENIIKQINIVVEKNIKEIVLTGIHIGQWGQEFNMSLINLLKEIEKTKISRYRLGSLYTNELNDELIDFLSQSEKFCPHFHLSLQSLCDKTLKNMNRDYTSSDAMKLIEKLHNKFHLPYIGCDIIAGFPYENEDDFNTTYQNLKKSELSSIHCFPYSKREGTPAYNMPQVQDKIKTQRMEKLTRLSKELKEKFIEKNKNTIQEILIEKKSQKTGYYTAMTKNYIRIKFKDDNENLRHTIKKVCLKDYEIIY